MARALNTDFLHSMRYHVVLNPGPIVNDLLTFSAPGRADAGFSNVTTPEATVEAVEYKEGTMVYTQKYPGNPTIADITLSRGVARADSSFWQWIKIVMEGAPEGTGAAEYRADLDIKHYHRAQALQQIQPTVGNNEQLLTDDPARIYHIKQGFPIRHKVAGDLDATASEISIMELDIAYEHFDVEEFGV